LFVSLVFFSGEKGESGNKWKGNSLKVEPMSWQPSNVRSSNSW
jgi:hypothetical protein